MERTKLLSLFVGSECMYIFPPENLEVIRILSGPFFTLYVFLFYTHIFPLSPSLPHFISFPQQQCGTISEVRLIKSQSRGRANAFAYVEFAATESVQKALQLEHTELNGRIVFVSQHREKGGGGKTQQKQAGFQVRTSLISSYNF